MIGQLSQCFSGKKVLITGHTGFKGTWLTHWLSRLGADIIGMALEPDRGSESLFAQSGTLNLCSSNIVDIRQYDRVLEIMQTHRPEFVFHLAAQALVPASYDDPLGTFASNIMGTVNVLEAARLTKSVKNFVCITTDKVYENSESNNAFVESDKLGGQDPYSASKSAAEMVARPYMYVLNNEETGFALATARGGNVVGGGDWSDRRLVPDIIKSIQSGEPITLRRPNAVRPWQHVLELCFGYLVLAMRLSKGFPVRKMARADFVGSWNFGPNHSNEVSVNRIVEIMQKGWQGDEFIIEYGSADFHESEYLRLDSSKSRDQLDWKPLLDIEKTMLWTCNWYEAAHEDTPPQVLIQRQIEKFEHLIKSENDK